MYESLFQINVSEGRQYDFAKEILLYHIGSLQKFVGSTNTSDFPR